RRSIGSAGSDEHSRQGRRRVTRLLGGKRPWIDLGHPSAARCLPGIDFDGDGVRDLVLCVTNVNGNVECADKNVKDVFVEFDTMTGQPGNVAALTQVVTAFANAPVNNPTPTGTGPTGVRLHIQLDDNNLTYAD